MAKILPFGPLYIADGFVTMNPALLGVDIRPAEAVDRPDYVSSKPYLPFIKAGFPVVVQRPKHIGVFLAEETSDARLMNLMRVLSYHHRNETGISGVSVTLFRADGKTESKSSPNTSDLVRFVAELARHPFAKQRTGRFSQRAVRGSFDFKKAPSEIQEIVSTAKLGLAEDQFARLASQISIPQISFKMMRRTGDAEPVFTAYGERTFYWDEEIDPNVVGKRLSSATADKNLQRCVVDSFNHACERNSNDLVVHQCSGPLYDRLGLTGIYQYQRLSVAVGNADSDGRRAVASMLWHEPDPISSMLRVAQ